MADVSLYVAAVTASAGVLGAAVTQIPVSIRESGKARRDYQEHRAEQWRQGCIELVRAAGELRTAVANAVTYHGDDMNARLEGIRAGAADVNLQAVSVALLGQGELAEPAHRLGQAARGLADQAVQGTDQRAQEIVERPAFAEFDDSLASFQDCAISGRPVEQKQRTRRTLAWRKG